MMTLTHKAPIFSAALVLALILTSAAGLPGRTAAQSDSAVTWEINSETEHRQTGTSEDWSETTEQRSDDGQQATHKQTRHVNEDGSSHEHEEFNYSNKDGTRGEYRRDTDTDAKGNRKVHYEETWDENGKCERVIIDEEYDSNNNRTLHSEKRELCGKFSLEISLEGTVTTGDTTIVFGPNTMTIPLALNNDIYEGRAEGQFNASISGKCSGGSFYPVSFEVTAQETETNSLEISITSDMAISTVVACEDGGSSINHRPPPGPPRIFTLPAEHGASKIFAAPDGSVIVTYTLKRHGH